MRKTLILATLLCVALSAQAEDPTIRALFPKNVTPGCTVTLVGRHIAPVCEENIVKLDETAVEVTRCTRGHIQFAVPDDIAVGEYAVTLTVGEAVSNAATLTVVEPGVPEIESISPESGAPGRLVKIRGANLGQCGGSITVMFGEVETTGTAWRKRIYTQVPEGVLGEVPVKVIVNDVASNELTFTVTEAPVPVIEAITPESGAPGKLVAIKGENFCQRFRFFYRERPTNGDAAQGAAVMFDDVEAKVVFCCARVILAVVPAMEPTDAAQVTVTAGGQTSEAVNFQVLEAATPVVTGLSPEAGPIGTRVTIAGEELGGHFTEVTVDFNGTPAEIVQMNRRRGLMAVVPEGATTGPVTVTVNGITADNTPEFTVEETPAPVIEEIRPESAPAGARIVILGQNLGSRHARPTVTFTAPDAEEGVTVERVEGPYKNWREEKEMLMLRVPADLAVGTYQVTVTVGETASEAVDFEVIEREDIPEMPGNGIRR